MSARLLSSCLLAILGLLSGGVGRTSAKPPDLPSNPQDTCAPQAAPSLFPTMEPMEPRRYPNGRLLLQSAFFGIHPAAMFLADKEFIHCDDDEPLPVIEIGGKAYDTGLCLGGTEGYSTAEPETPEIQVSLKVTVVAFNQTGVKTIANPELITLNNQSATFALNSEFALPRFLDMALPMSLRLHFLPSVKDKDLIVLQLDGEATVHDRNFHTGQDTDRYEFGFGPRGFVDSDGSITGYPGCWSPCTCRSLGYGRYPLSTCRFSSTVEAKPGQTVAVGGRLESQEPARHRPSATADEPTLLVLVTPELMSQVETPVSEATPEKANPTESTGTDSLRDISLLLEASQRALAEGRRPEAKLLAKYAQACDPQAVANHPLVYKMHLLKQLGIRNHRTTAWANVIKRATALTNYQGVCAELMTQYESLYKETRFRDAESLARVAHQIDPESAAYSTAIKIARLAQQAHATEASREPAEAPVNEYHPITEWFLRVGLENVRPPCKTQAERDIEYRLSQPVALIFVEKPLKKALQDISAWQDINIFLDEKSLDDEGIDPNVLLSFDEKNLSLKSCLYLMLGQLNLTYTIQNEVLFVTTEKHARGKLVQRSYAVADLVTPFRDYDDNLPTRLVDLILVAVKPDCWDRLGGVGSIDYYPLTKSLVINQTADVHEIVQDLLANLRQLQEDKQRELDELNEELSAAQQADDGSQVGCCLRRLEDLEPAVIALTRKVAQQMLSSSATVHPCLPAIDAGVVGALENVLKRAEEAASPLTTSPVEPPADSEEQEPHAPLDAPPPADDLNLPLYIDPPVDLIIVPAEEEAVAQAVNGQAELSTLWRGILDLVSSGVCVELDKRLDNWQLRCQFSGAGVLLDLWP